MTHRDYPGQVIRRARLIAVVAILAAGALGIVSSTQTWLIVTLADGAHADLTVSGAAAVPVLAPLSLAVLTLGLALSIVGIVLRYLFGVLTVAIAVVLTSLTAQVALAHPASAVASTVTEATGITGDAAVSGLVSQITASPWPVVTLAAWVVLLAAGVFTLATARMWLGSARRYDADAVPSPRGGAARPHDAVGSGAIDDWDDLSRGEDPTT